MVKSFIKKLVYKIFIAVLLIGILLGGAGGVIYIKECFIGDKEYSPLAEKIGLSGLGIIMFVIFAFLVVSICHEFFEDYFEN